MPVATYNEVLSLDLAAYYGEILEKLGEDTTREGLVKTPERVAKAMQFLTSGYHLDPAKILRVVDVFARRLQVQERLTDQILHCIQDTLNPLGVAVVIESSHMCMIMRGVQKQNSVTTTSAFTGAFKEQETRNEFLHLIAANLIK